MTRLARAALLAVGCGHAAPAATPAPGSTHVARVVDAGPDAPPPKLEDDLPRLATRDLEMFQAWQRALAEAGTDCAAATAKINQVAIDFADAIEANSQVIRGGRQAKLRDALAQHGEELDAAAERIMHSQTMPSCMNDPQFERAVERLGGPPL